MVAMLITRPIVGRFGDRIGYRRIFIPSLVLITLGMVCLAAWPARMGLIVAASVFALGFGAAYPTFAAYVMQDVGEARRGAAFGAIIAAFDTGIGAGSTMTGWLSGQAGFPFAFAVAAGLSALALPAFLVMDRRHRRTRIETAEAGMRSTAESAEIAEHTLG
jgi:MFS family permease